MMLTLRMERYSVCYCICLLLSFTLSTMSNNVLHINCSDVNVCVSLFDSLAVAFHTKLDGYGREPRIVLVYIYIYHFHLYQKEEKNILQQ